MSDYTPVDWFTPPFEDHPDLGKGCRTVNGSAMDRDMYYGMGYQTDGWYWRIQRSKADAYFRERRNAKAERKAVWQTREAQDEAFRVQFPETDGRPVA